MNFIHQLGAHWRGALGQPVLIEAWAAQVPAEQKRIPSLISHSIRSGNVVRWDQWGEETRPDGFRRPKHALVGWAKGYAGEYEQATQYCVELENMRSETVGTLQCDIQDVHGLSSSKSDLSQHATMEDFAIKNCDGLIGTASSDALAKTIEWHEIGIRNAKSSDHFCRYDWDGRLFVINSGGSHHFAAAQHLAKNLGQEIPLTGKIKTIGLNQRAVSDLRDRFEIFAVPNDPASKNQFWEGMKSVGAAHFCLPLPSGLSSNQETVLLPRNDPQAMKVAAVLRKEGFWNVGETLAELALGAHRHDLSSMPQTALPPARISPSSLGQVSDMLIAHAHPVTVKEGAEQAHRALRRQATPL